MLPLIVLFIVVPLLELYVIIEVGQLIGAVPTIAILLLDSVLGAILLRAQGRAAWRRFNAALAERRVPGREIFDGAMIVFGAALLLTPGFLTDALGLLLLIPPTRSLLRRGLTKAAKHRIARGRRVAFWTYDRFTDPGEPAGPGPASSYDYEGTAQEIPQVGESLPKPDRESESPDVSGSAR